jgi:flagellin-like protein
MRSFDKAISELIGALILIMLVAGILGIVMTVLLSQPPPEKLPAVDFNLKIDDPFLVPGTGTASQMPKIRIFHDRGDPFKIFYDSDSDESSSFS